MGETSFVKQNPVIRKMVINYKVVGRGGRSDTMYKSPIHSFHLDLVGNLLDDSFDGIFLNSPDDILSGDYYDLFDKSNLFKRVNQKIVKFLIANEIHDIPLYIVELNGFKMIMVGTPIDSETEELTNPFVFYDMVKKVIKGFSINHELKPIIEIKVNLENRSTIFKVNGCEKHILVF